MVVLANIKTLNLKEIAIAHRLAENLDEIVSVHTCTFCTVKNNMYMYMYM